MSDHQPTGRYLSGRTTPTWEVELLISGVAVFAMLQLPGLLDDWLFAVEPRVGEDWRMTVVLSYVYAKGAALVLAATFVLHLLLRALWIALVGIHSVYPLGVRMDRMKMGPIQTRVTSELGIDLPSAIERADNRASVVFAIGVMVALLISVICIIFPGSLLVLNLLSGWLGIRFDPVIAFCVIAGLVIGPFLLAAVVDQAIGTRLQPDGLLYRAIHWILRKASRSGFGSSNSLIMMVMASNDGQKRMHAMFFAIMMLALGGVAAGMVAMRKPDVLGSYGLFPRIEARQLAAAQYADQRDPARAGALPYIQSKVIDGPYLALTVPYEPRRVGNAMRGCNAPDAPKDRRADALLGCLQSLHAVTLDGEPLSDLRYEIASDAPTGRPALLAMIDVRDLALGRHELTVARPARADKKPDKDDPDPGLYRIVFWR